MKLLHIACALISITGFSLRTLLKLFRPDMLQARWLKITPHIVDTLLLVSAIYLVIVNQFYPAWFNWVSAKIVALLVYIGFGFLTLRFGQTRKMVIINFILALLTFAYIIAVARTKQVWPLMI